jgi:nucleotide-binding universal stress UspA family protein
MAFKTLLLPIASYPEPTPPSAINDAVHWAALLGARLVALAFEMDFRVPGNPLAHALIGLPSIVENERGKSLRNAQTSIELFAAAAGQANVDHDHVIERRTAAQIPDYLAVQARLHDLTILPHEGGMLRQLDAECVIFGSGRPVLIAPVGSAQKSPGLDTVAIAWDFSRSAARAVADALPLLQQAKTVRILTVQNEKRLDGVEAGLRLAQYLERHGIRSTSDAEDAAGRSIGEVFRAYAKAHDLGLLVMGAYGQSRLREFVLGGATRSILGDPPVSVLLSH